MWPVVGRLAAVMRAVAVALSLALAACMDYGPTYEEAFDWSGTPAGEGLFVVNEGNFMYGNASLSFYSAADRSVENEVFLRANGERLGDVAQSMTIRDGRGYIVVNNSGVIFIVDIDNAYVIGSVDGLVSPRYVHFVDDAKAYATDLYASAITVFNPKTGAITGRIETPGHMSTEQMVQYGEFVFVNCWSYDDCILVVDTRTDTVVDEIKVGIQPTSMVLDRYGKIWTITDGGYEGSPYGWEEPGLYRIDAATRRVEKVFLFDRDRSPSELCIDGRGETIFFIDESIWKMDAKAETLPAEPLVPYAGTKFYGLAVNPYNSEVYVADAIDYVQKGVVYRYSPDGVLVDKFTAGITPGAFCFR